MPTKPIDMTIVPKKPEPDLPLQPKNTADLRFKFTPIAPGATAAKPAPRQVQYPIGKIAPTPPRPPAGQTYQYERRMPTWFDPQRDSFEMTAEGKLRLMPSAAVLQQDKLSASLIPGYKSQFDSAGGETIDPGEYGKDWTVTPVVQDGQKYYEYTFSQKRTTDAERQAQQQQARAAMPGEQQFGLAPGDPNTTLRGGLAQFMGNPVVKAGETVLGGALPGAIVGTAILPGIGTVIGAAGGTALSWLAGQEQYDQNSIAARGMGALGGAAIGTALLPGIGTIAGGIIGALAGPEILDAGRAGLEGAIGVGEQVVGSIAEPGKYGTLDQATKDLKATWEAARLTYETSTLFGEPGKLFGADDKVFVDWDLPEQTGGLSAIVEARQRIANGEDATMVRADIASRFGAPGQLRELGSGFALDPLNFVDVAQKKIGMPLLAKIGGDDLLKQAAEMPGRAGAVDIFQRYRELLMSEKEFRTGFRTAQDMNRMQRLAIGKELIELADKGTYTQPKWWELWKLTPESAAKDRVVQADNFIQAHLSALPNDDTLPERAVALMNTLKTGEAPAGMPGLDEASRAANTIEGRVIRNHLDVAAVEDAAAAWQATSNERLIVQEMAQKLDMAPAAVVKELRAALTPTLSQGARAQTFDDLAAKLGGLKVGETAIDAGALAKIAKVFEDDAVPYTPEHFKAAVIGSQIEASGKWAASTFGIKAPGFAERVAGAVKAVQSTVLLGLNPSYVVNNIVNGEVTMAARGVWGLRGIVEARDELSRAGIEPMRLADGGHTIGDLDVVFDHKTLIGEMQAGGMAEIGKAKEYTGALADIKRKGSSVGGKMPFQIAAGKVEKAQSLRSFYEGWKQYMGQQWKAGKSLPKMTAGLEESLANIDPRLPGYFYAAAEAGVNPAEIAGKIFDAPHAPVVQLHVNAVAAGLGMQADDVTRVLSIDGLDGQLNERLAEAGNNPGKIRKAFDETRAEAEKSIAEAHAQEVQEASQYAAQAAQVGDPGEMLNLMDDVEMRLYETYTGHMRTLEEEWDRILSSGKGVKDVLIRAQKDRASQQWKGFFDYEDAVTRGMADGMKAGGLELHENFNTAARAKRSLIDQFHEAKNGLLDEFFARPEAERTPEAWAAVTGEINGQYAKLSTDLNAITDGVDTYISAEFARRYNTQTGEAVAAWRKRTRELKQEDMNAVNAFRVKVSKVRAAQQKNAMWRAFNEERTVRLHQIESEAIGLRRKASEVMNLVKTADVGPQTTGTAAVSADLAEVMNLRTFSEAATAMTNEPMPNVKPNAALSDESIAMLREAGVKDHIIARIVNDDAAAAYAERARTPVMIGETVVDTETAAAIADVVQREMAVESAANNLTPTVAPARMGLANGGLLAWDAAPVGDVPVALLSPREELAGQVRKFVAGRKMENAQTDAVMALIDARAEVWSRQTGLPVDEYIPRHFAITGEQAAGYKNAPGLSSAESELWQRGGRKPAPGQTDMFAATSEDLPLFSGVAAGAADSAFRPAEVGQQQVMPGMENRPEFGNTSVGAAPLPMTREGWSTDAERAQVMQEMLNADQTAMNARVAEAQQYLPAKGLVDERGAPLFQEGQGAKGSTQFLDDGTAVLKALRAPDVSTAVHEVAHVFRRDLAQVAEMGGPGAAQAAADLQEAGSWVAQQAIELSQRAERGELKPAQRAAFDFAEGNNWIDAIDDNGEWTRAGEEIFARGFEQYMRDGTAPSAGLARVFENFKAWLSKIYKRVKGSPIDTEISPEMRGVYDRLLAESEAIDQASPLAPILAGEGKRLPAPVDNPQLLQRHELPGTLSTTLDDLAGQMMREINEGTPGQRIFTDTGEIIGQASTYPQWYRDISAKYGTRKDLVIGALDKIQRDNGIDKGLTVERLKEVMLERLADGWEDPIGGRIPADPEAASLLGRPEDQIQQAQQEWAQAMQPSLQPSPTVRGEAYYQTPDGKMVMATPSGDAVVTGIDDHTITIELNGEEKKIPIIAKGDAPLPPGVLADMRARPMPIAQALDESFSNHLRPVLDTLQRSIEDGLNAPPLKRASELPPELQQGLRQWVDQVNGKLATTKLQATRWGEYKRDSALLNYSRRYQYNTYLGMVAPYEFWMTQSMIKWALHSIDRPAVLAMYYRTDKFLKTQVTKSGMPDRLAGKIRIPMPFLPDWMGDGAYYDPFANMLPIQNWAAPWESEQTNAARVDSAAERVLKEWQDKGTLTETLTQEEKLSAFERAKAEAIKRDPSLVNDPMDTLMSVFSPSLPLKMAIDKLRGKEASQSLLPMTRSVRALSAVLGVGGPSGINLEAGIRRQMGLPILDQWADYRIDRELSNMAGEGLITADQAKAAMIGRSGPEFEQAQRREAQVSALSTLSSNVFGSMAVYPEGEQNQRQLAELKKAAWNAEQNGDTGALGKFFDEHPEYEARMALGQDPDERLRNFLVDKIWTAWNEMPRVYKTNVEQGLGMEFSQSFMNKATRSYESIPIETLQRWAVTVGSEIPGRPEVKPIPIQYAPPEMAQAVEAFYRERDATFQMDQINAAQSAYFEIPQDAKVTYQTGVYVKGAKKGQPKYGSTSQRDLFINQHPELEQYWDWRKNWLSQAPGAQAYIDEEKNSRAWREAQGYNDYATTPAGGQEQGASQWSAEMGRVVKASVFTGRKLPATVEKQLKKEWESAGSGATFDQWLMYTIASKG